MQAQDRANPCVARLERSTDHWPFPLYEDVCAGFAVAFSCFRIDRKLKARISIHRSKHDVGRGEIDKAARKGSQGNDVEAVWKIGELLKRFPKMIANGRVRIVVANTRVHRRWVKDGFHLNQDACSVARVHSESSTFLVSRRDGWRSHRKERLMR